MITLITGGPGTGKTAWLLAQLLLLREQEPNRLLFIHGVRNLRGIAHETIYCRSQLCDICRLQDGEIQQRLTTSYPPKFVEDWPKWKESGALIIVDEVQRIWRPTNGGAGPSEAISALETHRHYGLDFWLISQGPHLFHNFIRLLVGRHVHLVAKWSGRKEFEWPECKQDVQSRSDAVMRPYSLPKHVYDMYDSAEVHTVQEKRKPLSFYATIAALVLSVLMAGFVVKRIKDRMAPVEVAAAQSSPAPGAGPDTINPVTHEQSGAVSIDTPEKLQVAMTPIVPGVPWSAPFYKELVKPVSFPRIAGCIKSKKQGDFRCACYSQQGTIVEVPPDVCSLYVQRHAFNPFKPDSNAIEAPLAQNMLASKSPG